MKNYRNASLPYTPSEMVGADRRPVFGDFDPHSICTSHVERNNFTIRTFVRRFARLSVGFSKKLENLAAAIALHTAHYNVCRRHATLRMATAMKAGVSRTLWSVPDLYDRAMAVAVR